MSNKTDKTGQDKGSFFEKNLNRVIPDWQRGKKTSGKTSEEDSDTLGVVVPEHVEHNSSSPHTTRPNKSNQSTKKGGEVWWPEKSKKPPELSEGLGSNESELDLGGLKVSRHYKILLGLAAFLMICATGLGLKGHQDNVQLAKENQAIEQLKDSVTQFNSALFEGTNDEKTSSLLSNLINNGQSQVGLLNRFPEIQKQWKSWDFLANPISKNLDSLVSWQQQATHIATQLHSGWDESRVLWTQAGQSNAWGNQTQVLGAIDGMESWSNLALEASRGKGLSDNAASLEKAITQSLQATSGLNNDTTLLGKTWKSVAQNWIKTRPSILDLIKNAPTVNTILNQKNQIKEESSNFFGVINQAQQNLSDASLSSGYKEILALALFILSMGCVFLGLLLNLRQVRFFATNAKQDLSSQSDSLFQMNEVIKSISMGSRGAKIPVRGGLIGEVAKSINQLLESLEKTHFNQLKALKDLYERLENIQMNSGELTDKGNQLLDALALSAQSLLILEESTEVLDRQSSSADEMLSQSKKASEEGEVSVSGMGKNMIDLQSKLQETSKGVENIMESSHQIAASLENLSHLSAQIEVLSIQTDLRAVQSEQGEPFRLVAQEMHNLADQNELLVKRIYVVLDEVLREGQNSLEAANQAVMTTESSARLSDLTEESWRNLSGSNLKMSELMDEMREAAINQSQMIEDLTQHAQNGLGLTQEISIQASQSTGFIHETIGVCQVTIENLKQVKKTS